MATMREVVRAYRPELEKGEPPTDKEIMDFLVEKSELSAEQVSKMIEALGGLVFWYVVRAQPVSIPGLGSFHPTIDLAGTIDLGIDTDADLSRRMNDPGEYRAGINRHENIGVPLERLAQMWNSANPDDPVIDLDAYAVPG